MITSLERFPEECNQCDKPRKTSACSECDLCRDIRFQEEIFCDLNRSAQANNESFKCHAFVPASMSAVSLVSGVGPLRNSRNNVADTADLEAQLNTDRLNYCHALAVQKLERDPDAVYAELKYHVAWNVVSRKQVFTYPDAAIAAIQKVLFSHRESTGCCVELLRLAPDHIHLYIESNGQKSIDAIVRSVKRSSVRTLRGIMDIGRRRVWDKAYFVETLG